MVDGCRERIQVSAIHVGRAVVRVQPCVGEAKCGNNHHAAGVGIKPSWKAHQDGVGAICVLFVITIETGRPYIHIKEDEMTRCNVFYGDISQAVDWVDRFHLTGSILGMTND